MLCILAWFGLVSAKADYFERHFIDPEGEAFAQKLLASGEMTDSDFTALLSSDPGLTKRAWVSVCIIGLKTKEEEDRKALVSFCFYLAQFINDELKDPAPLEILSQMKRDREGAVMIQSMEAYLDKQRPPLPQNAYWGDRTGWDEYSPDFLAALRIFAVKYIRLHAARSGLNYRVLVSELDTIYPALAQWVEVTKQVSPETLKLLPADWTESTSSALTIEGEQMRCAAFAELNQLENVEESLKKLEKIGEHDAPVETLLAAYYAAYRRRLVSEAREYIQRARKDYVARTADLGPNPVLDFALRTAEYQQRKLEGWKPTDAQTLDAFREAWLPIETYEPYKFWDQDSSWVEGRVAAMQWLDEASNTSDSGLEIARIILAGLKHDRQRGQELLFELLGQQATAHFEEYIALTTLDDATWDLRSEIWVRFPSVTEGKTSLDLADYLESVSFGMDSDEYHPTDGYRSEPDEGPGFPEFSLEKGGMSSENKARAGLLRAMADETPITDKAGLLTQAAEFARETGNPVTIVRYLILCAQRAKDFGFQEQAIKFWTEALEISEQAKLVQDGLKVASFLAKEYASLGDWEKADAFAQRASGFIEAEVPLADVRDESGKALTHTSREMTALSVKAAVELDKPEEALAALTREQQIQSAAVQMSGQEKVRAEATEVAEKEKQVAVLEQQVKVLESMPASETRDSLLSGSESLLADTRAEFLTDTRRLRQKYSDVYGKVLRFDPLSLADVQKTLPPDVAVVQHFPTQDALYIFLVTAKDFRLRQVPIGRRELERTTREYVRAIRRASGDDKALATASASLYKTLIGPVESELASCQTVVLIPSGVLSSLPFASLTDAAGEPLGVKKSVLSLAKSTDLVRVPDEAQHPIEKMVIFANATGDLPSASKEGAEIAHLFPGAKLFDTKEATRDAFVKFGGDADALHVATHGEWNVEDSLSNYLSMADETKVSQDEIFELNLDHTSLVILSACNTAMGDGGDVSYVASLAEAFWIAGSQSVVASLWSVNDESTSLLMSEFYKNLKNGEGKADALRDAQKAVRANPRFQHPYYWAGFVLFGNWN